MTLLECRALPALTALALAVAASSAGCAHVATQQIAISVQGVDCVECAAGFMPAIAQQPGVRRAEFDKQAVEVKIDATQAFDVRQTIATIEKAGFHASVGAGKGKYTAGAAYPDGADARVVVDNGNDVPDIAQLAVPGKLTVVDFYADWCGPCKDVDKHLAELIARRPDLAVRKLNILDWDSPLARHYAATVPALPAQIVFGADGKQIASISGLDLKALDRAVGEGAH